MTASYVDMYIENAKTSVDIAPSQEGWTSYRFNVHDFADLPTITGHYLVTPQFSCNEHQWDLEIGPGGNSQ